MQQAHCVQHSQFGGLRALQRGRAERPPPGVTRVAFSAQQQQQVQSQGPTGRTSTSASLPAAEHSQGGSSSNSGTDAAPASLLERLRLRSKPKQHKTINERYRLFMEEYEKGYMDAVEEPEGYWLEAVYGRVPKELHGTLFRNGPGKFTIGSSKVAHPLDGDGLVASIAFEDGAAYFRSRFVRTAEYKAESATQRIMFRGSFATQRAGGPAQNALDIVVKNTANTNVVCWGGRLLALFEAGQPYRLDPVTLETQGLDDMGGCVAPGLPFDLGSAAGNSVFSAFTRLRQQRLGTTQHLPAELLLAGGDAHTAHPHYDSTTDRLVSFSYRVKPTLTAQGQAMNTTLTFLEFDRQWNRVASKEYDLSCFAFVHDFAVTEHYYLLFQNPVTVDSVPYLLGTAPAASCVRWVPNTPTLVHLVPRPGTKDPAGRPLQPLCFRAPPLFVFHHANAYEADSGRKIVVDSIHYDSLPAVGREALAEQQIDSDVAFNSRLRRVEIDLDSSMLRLYTSFGGYLEMCSVSEAVSGRPHRYVYSYNSDFESPAINIAKVDMQQNTVTVWQPGCKRFALEPRFVPRPGAAAEDDGWLLSQVWDSEHVCSELVILDARDLTKGPLAVLRMRRPLPIGLHGHWSSQYYGPAEVPPPQASNVVPFPPAAPA